MGPDAFADHAFVLHPDLLNHVPAGHVLDHYHATDAVEVDLLEAEGGAVFG